MIKNLCMPISCIFIFYHRVYCTVDKTKEAEAQIYASALNILLAKVSWIEITLNQACFNAYLSLMPEAEQQNL